MSAGREDADDARKFNRLGTVDFHNSRVRVSAAQNRRVRHPDAMNITDEFSDPAEEPEIFFAFNS